MADGEHDASAHSDAYRIGRAVLWALVIGVVVSVIAGAIDLTPKPGTLGLIAAVIAFGLVLTARKR